MQCSAACTVVLASMQLLLLQHSSAVPEKSELTLCCYKQNQYRIQEKRLLAVAGDSSGGVTFQSVLDQASQVRSKNQQWAHTLRVAGLLLQQVPSARLRTAGAGRFQCIEDLWPQLILPGLTHAVASVR